MNTSQLRDLRVRTQIGYAVQSETLLSLVETVEGALHATEADDVDSLVEQIDELKRNLKTAEENAKTEASTASALRDALENKGEELHVAQNEADRLRDELAALKAAPPAATEEAVTLTLPRLAGFLIDQAEHHRIEASTMRTKLVDYDAVSLNGAQVTIEEGTMFIALPKPLWRRNVFSGTCNCGKCGGDNMWDTLAIAMKPLRSRAHIAWTVHRPAGRTGA